MEDNRPWALLAETSDRGNSEADIDIMNQHFQTICYKDFLQNQLLHGPEIEAVFVMNTRPVVEPSLLNSLPSLKVVANAGVGVDHLDVPYINSVGVKVTNTPGVVSDATADMALGLLLASARNIVEGESSRCHVSQGSQGQRFKEDK